MKKNKQHILLRGFVLFLAMAILLPTAVKLAHAFNHHEHVVCLGDSSTHIHKVDLDCEFHKFQLSNHFLLPNESYNWSPVTNYSLTLSLTYKFINNHRTLSFSLRGPPILV